MNHNMKPTIELLSDILKRPELIEELKALVQGITTKEAHLSVVNTLQYVKFLHDDRGTLDIPSPPPKRDNEWRNKNGY